MFLSFSNILNEHSLPTTCLSGRKSVTSESDTQKFFMLTFILYDWFFLLILTHTLLPIFLTTLSRQNGTTFWHSKCQPIWCSEYSYNQTENLINLNSSRKCRALYSVDRLILLMDAWHVVTFKNFIKRKFPDETSLQTLPRFLIPSEIVYSYIYMK